MDPQDFLCQAWLSEQRMVVGTGTGSVLLFDSGELKAEINVDERLTCVAPFSRGFVLGGASGYVLSPSLSQPAPGLVYWLLSRMLARAASLVLNGRQVMLKCIS